MSTPTEYEQYALECLRLAERADNAGNNAFMLEMAQSWIRLAEQAKEKDDSNKANAET